MSYSAIQPVSIPMTHGAAGIGDTIGLAPLPAQQPEGPSFAEMMRSIADQSVSLPQQADAAVLQSLRGDDISQVEVMSAVKKADLALRMMVQVRNKVLEAYNEVQQLRF